MWTFFLEVLAACGLCQHFSSNAMFEEVLAGLAKHWEVAMCVRMEAAIAASMGETAGNLQ